jgi:hypothetical protein
LGFRLGSGGDLLIYSKGGKEEGTEEKEGEEEDEPITFAVCKRKKIFSFGFPLVALPGRRLWGFISTSFANSPSFHF